MHATTLITTDTQCWIFVLNTTAKDMAPASTTAPQQRCCCTLTRIYEAAARHDVAMLFQRSSDSYAEELEAAAGILPGSAADGSVEQMLFTQGHFPSRLPPKKNKQRAGLSSQKRCRVCYRHGVRKETTFCCARCPGQPGLCSGRCFTVYHGLQYVPDTDTDQWVAFSTHKMDDPLLQLSNPKTMKSTAVTDNDSSEQLCVPGSDLAIIPSAADYIHSLLHTGELPLQSTIKVEPLSDDTEAIS